MSSPNCSHRQLLSDTRRKLLNKWCYKNRAIADGASTSPPGRSMPCSAAQRMRAWRKRTGCWPLGSTLLLLSAQEPSPDKDGLPTQRQPAAGGAVIWGISLVWRGRSRPFGRSNRPVPPNRPRPGRQGFVRLPRKAQPRSRTRRGGRVMLQPCSRTGISSAQSTDVCPLPRCWTGPTGIIATSRV